MIEQPVVQVTAKPMEQDRGVASFSALEIAHRLAEDLDRFGLRGSTFVFSFFGHETGLKLGHEGVDLPLRYAAVGDHPNQARHRHHIADLRDLPDDARLRDFETAGDLLRFDLDDFIAGSNFRAILGEPGDNFPLGHGEAPLRHR